MSHSTLSDSSNITLGAPPWSNGSVFGHGSLSPVFESRRGHIWRLFHVWLRLITLGGRSAHLAYHVHKSGRKTPIIIINVSFTDLESWSTVTGNDRKNIQTNLASALKRKGNPNSALLRPVCSSSKSCRQMSLAGKIYSQAVALFVVPGVSPGCRLFGCRIQIFISEPQNNVCKNPVMI